MKKRICFVGFADAQLKALKHAVAGITSAWDCVFVANGSAALEAMAAGPYDAVVANMRMGRMNGAELLHHIGQTYPKTLRFIVGDVSDQEIIINCIGGTHQFIAQPCEPHILISTIQRSLALDVWLSSEQLRAIVPKLHRLPSLPSTYFEVLKQVESPHTSVQSVGEVIARDPAATARLLQMVNSAAFAFSEKIADPVQAVALLGMETVKSLVLCLQVFSQDDAAQQAGVSFSQLWEHSFSVATMARQIALQETGDARTAYEAFTAGLLHDVGRIVIASNLPQEYAAVTASAREKSRPLHEEEIAQLGVSHAQVGAYLLGVWGMPATVVEAAALHHSPNASFAKEFSLLTAVHVANVFAYERGTGHHEFARPQLDTGYLETLGLAGKPDLWRRSLVGNAGRSAAATPPKPANEPVEETTETAPTPPAPRRSLLAWLFIPAAAAAIIAVVASVNWNKSDSDDVIKVDARTVHPSLPPTPAPATPSTESVAPQNTEVSPATAQPGKAPAAEPVTSTPAKRPTTVESASTSPATPAPEQKSAVPATVDVFASIKVQGIIYRADHPSVLINGKALFVGDRINGLRVAAIEPTKVTVASNDKQKVFVVK